MYVCLSALAISGQSLSKRSSATAAISKGMKLGWNSQPVAASCTLAFLQMAGMLFSINVVNDARWITPGRSANVLCHDSMGLALGDQLGSRPLPTPMKNRIPCRVLCPWSNQVASFSCLCFFVQSLTAMERSASASGAGGAPVDVVLSLKSYLSVGNT